MPAPATVPEFLELVRKSGLAPAAEVDELLARHRAAGVPQSVDQAAALLVRDAQLTYFQAKQLKFGRYKRFTIGAKYRLLELIGAGGMGAVYLCEHTLMRRLVALKVLPVEKLDDRSNLERFYREARAVAALDHPNIVRAYDIDQYEKLHFLVMEYVDGHSLQEIIARYALEKKRFDPTRAAHYVAQAAVGMQHAHELGMVHRDIKPGNVLLDRTGVIKVLDMGLARFFNKQQDSVTEKYDEKCVLGTADYLAPEQARTNVVDVRADIYSLGGTLYFMLTGQTPFPDGTIAAKLVAHQNQEPRPVESFRPDVPAGLLAVLRKMMAKRPAERYQEPVEVAEALAEWADRPAALPAEREMPALCPLVQALAGPSAERSGAHQPLARVLFGPGRGVFARGGSSANIRTRPAEAKPGDPPPAKSAPRYAPDESVPVSGPVSTARASASPTVPLPVPAPAAAGSSLAKGKRPGPPPPADGESRLRPKPRPAKAEPRPPTPALSRRTLLITAAAVAVGTLFVTAALVAYQLGKGNKADASAANDSTPNAADEFLTPQQAAQRVGEEHAVEFKVASVSEAGYLALNSQPQPGTDANFAVRIKAEYFAGLGGACKAALAQAKQGFPGKTIRARGQIKRDPQGHGVYMDVEALHRVVTVGKR